MFFSVSGKRRHSASTLDFSQFYTLHNNNAFRVTSLQSPIPTLFIISHALIRYFEEEEKNNKKIIRDGTDAEGK